MELGGLHHMTAVTTNAAENVAFYTDVLGLRLVKKTVNQDDVSAYHLFYGDEVGNPGTEITFFDWPQLRLAPNHAGDIGMARRIAWADETSIPAGCSPTDPLRVQHHHRAARSCQIECRRETCKPAADDGDIRRHESLEGRTLRHIRERAGVVGISVTVHEKPPILAISSNPIEIIGSLKASLCP